MSNLKAPAPLVPHQCPSCHEPQTKIKRVLGVGKFGSSSFVCSRVECSLSLDVPASGREQMAAFPAR